MQDNIRVNRSKAKSLKTSLAEKPKAPTNKQKGKAEISEAEAVQLRIKRLRNFVKKAPALAQKQLDDRRDLVPAMDEVTPRKKKSPTGQKRIPMQKAQMARRRVMRLAFEFLVLALIIAAILGWLNQSFHFFF